ncbi:DGQHR domain-containing protein [Calothrix sp. PCC 6303]|uniref:DGQHR domain-containing protein n=1 Tax=Calothrix sp. PCC 6303 TaxID=1170562 RepID=UPI0002A0387E|nr:DGQHR domain-containing protein [Calothrix sp. PCC 6303]AFZ03874.1 DGQHR domain protein [Calothrix sp. PCC 6303]
MISRKSDPISDIFNQYTDLEERNKRLLSLILDQYLNSGKMLPVEKTEMGGTEAYVGSITLEWFASNIDFASHLDLLHHKYNPQTDNIEIDADSIDEIQQRPLDWSRQAALVQYLASRKHHKFPPVLVVVSQPWVDNPQATEWDSHGKATKSTIEFTPLDSEGKLGLLNLTVENITIHALDGQHRLMGVQGLMELLKNKKLKRYKKDKNKEDKTSTESFITIDNLIDQFNISHDYIKSLPQEKIGIEFISAVVAGETREGARRRVRSIFVHVNLMATPLTKGQLTQLDEDDGFSIIARKIAVTHPLLEQKEARKPRVNWNSATVATNSTVLTTLQAIKEMSERYLGQKFPHWKQEKGLISMRPEDEELTEGIAEFHQLFDYLASLSSYKVLEEETTPALRKFSFEKDGGEGNMLFRPVGQVALVQALGILVFKKGLSLEKIFKKLRKFDKQGGFSNIELPNSLWYGVLYDPNRKRISVAGKDLAAKLVIYILGGMKDGMEHAELRRCLAKARTFENQTISFEGKIVEPKDVGLPEIL